MQCRRVRDDLGDVGPAIEWAGQWISVVPEDLRFGIEVCLEEALANLILHGQSTDGDKDIAVEVAADSMGATVAVTDRCAPYDVVHAASPPREKADAMIEGGRGLRLMHSFATELAYATHDGRNQLTMIFRAP
jgi:anti-sigma regulatory factor (Ser/Thr protein kinase)